MPLWYIMKIESTSRKKDRATRFSSLLVDTLNSHQLACVTFNFFNVIYIVIVIVIVIVTALI